MRSLLGERFAPVTSSIGFLELPFMEAVEGLETWRRQLYPEVTVSPVTEGFPAGLHRLEPLVQGARPRELLVEVGANWTAYFDCSLRGTDADSAIGHLTRTLRCQGLAINATPHTIGLPGIKDGRSGG